jgi:hypothetical protein
MNLAAQQEAAQRQALEMLGAQANAQRRAMDSLKGAADLSTSMRGSSAQESQFNANAMDTADQFNKNLKDAYDKWKLKVETEQNEAKIKRGEAVAGNVAKIGASGVTAAGNIYDFGVGRAKTHGEIVKPYVDAKLKLGETEINKADGDETEDEVNL